MVLPGDEASVVVTVAGGACGGAAGFVSCEKANDGFSSIAEASTAINFLALGIVAFSCFGKPYITTMP
jgi:hypothetical protein